MAHGGSASQQSSSSSSSRPPEVTTTIAAMLDELAQLVRQTEASKTLGTPHLPCTVQL